MVELYTMQRYLQFNELEKMGLEFFDSWASTFGETVNAIDIEDVITGAPKYKVECQNILDKSA